MVIALSECQLLSMFFLFLFFSSFQSLTIFRAPRYFHNIAAHTFLLRWVPGLFDGFFEVCSGGSTSNSCGWLWPIVSQMLVWQRKHRNIGSWDDLAWKFELLVHSHVVNMHRAWRFLWLWTHASSLHQYTLFLFCNLPRHFLCSLFLHSGIIVSEEEIINCTQLWKFVLIFTSQVKKKASPELWTTSPTFNADMLLQYLVWLTVSKG